MTTSPNRLTSLFANQWVKNLLTAGLYLISFYLVFLIYIQGEILFAILVFVVIISAIYVFSNQKRYRWRYLYPGLSALGVFILFPLLCTVVISFSNYSGTNQLNFEQVLANLNKQTFSKGKQLDFKLKTAGNEQYRLFLEDKQSQTYYLSVPIDVKNPPKKVALQQLENPPELKNAPFKTITLNRKKLQTIDAVLPGGEKVVMSSLRKFSQQQNRFVYDRQTRILSNRETGIRYRPNDDIGFFQAVNSAGEFDGETLEPGYAVGIGWKNFAKIFTDEGMQKPLISIFLWTVLFALLSAVFVSFLGMVFASLLQWEAVKGKAVYRLLLILPYAVPAFISILIFKGLFNQSFGEINLILEHLFGIRPEWFNDPMLAKVMLLIVNTWLGYPYMMIVCMGLLKAIPSSLYEASAIDGATVWQNFSQITVPMLLKPMMPLIIATFAFNFNNFVLIQLLTEGNPSMIGTSTPAGHTDLLVSYTYRIAFEGSGTQDFGLAAAIAVIIFILVSILALFQIRLSKISQE